MKEDKIRLEFAKKLDKLHLKYKEKNLSEADIIKTLNTKMHSIIRERKTK